MDYDLLWSKVLEEVSTKVNSITFETYFKCAKLYKIEGNVATIIVPPSEIYRDQLSIYYLNELQASFQAVTNEIYDFNFLLEDEVNHNEQLSTIDVENSNILINKDDKPKIEYHYSSNLNKEYSFENFVVGNSNRLAHATAFAVAKSPGELYNPLFLYGSSGLGKTHLMQAIGNYIEENSDKKVLYVSSKDFTDDFIKISRDIEYAEYFKNKYRSIDVLIIDDIQYLATKPKTQEEFFHIFNVLHQDKKQIIISSDRSPNDLILLENRLNSRFAWGLTVDIFPPDLELRKNILRKKIQMINSLPEIDDEVIDYIAANVSDDVRKLEGSITKLMADSFVMGYDKITLPIAVESLKSIINKGTSDKPNILKIQKIVADAYKVSVDDLKGKKRSAVITGPRQIAMYLSKELLNESYERIGLEFGGKDHTTVMHSCDKIKKEIENNNELRNKINEIKKNVL